MYLNFPHTQVLKYDILQPIFGDYHIKLVSPQHVSIMLFLTEQGKQHNLFSVSLCLGKIPKHFCHYTQK